MSTMLRVLLVQPFDAYAGSQRVAQAMVTALARTGMDVSVKLGFGGKGFLSEMPGVRPEIRSDNIPFRKLLYPLWVLVSLVPLAWTTSRGRLVWVNTIYSVPPAMLAIMLFPSRTIIHLHEVTFPRPFHLLLSLAARRGAVLVCVSTDQANRLGVPAQILPNPVKQPATEIGSKPDRLLFVGTTQPLKGFDLFVAVCSRLNGLDLRMTAYLSDEGRHDQTLVQAAHALGVKVIFGERSLDEIYLDGFLVLLCTNPQFGTETFSLVAAEAVTRLVPVGGTGITVLAEVVGEALAFDEPGRDPDRIAQAIIALHGDRDRISALRAACARRRPHFAEAMFTERLLALLRGMEKPS